MAKRRNAITGQWAARSIEMLESPAYRTLSLSAHRALARIEIELAHHGGNDNGKLPVTFDDFVQYGVRRHSIGSSLDELETLGFIKITQHGKMAKGAEYRRPNLFLLATRPELEGVGPERCGWRRFQTLEEAERALDRVRARRQNLKAASAETAPKPSAETAPKAKFASAETAPLAMAETAPLAMAETAPLSISRVGTPSERGNLATHDHPEPTRPSRFRSRRAGARSFERWGQVKPDPAPAKRPRRAGGLSQTRWRTAPDTGSNSQRTIAPEALPSDAAAISNTHRADPPRLMVDVSTPPAPTAALVL
jgi:hypothetical protein